MLSSFFSHPFLVLALITGCAASITSGIIGSYVVVKRIVFISGSIAHSVLGGMGLAIWLKRAHNITWISPLGGALFAALMSAFLIGWIHLKYRQREDTVIAAIWSTGMALGVIFTALTPGYNVEIMNFLFGNILWINPSDLKILLYLDGIVLIATLLFHQKFLALCFDEEQAALQGISVTTYYLLLLSLVSLSVVILIQLVGAVLVITMLTIPSAIGGRFTHLLGKMMLIAVILGCLFTFMGLLTSYHLNWPPGATIALISALFYLLSLVIPRKFNNPSL